MKKGKLVINIFVIISAFTVFALWHRYFQMNTISTTTTSNQNFVIYLITIDKTDQFWQDLNSGAQDMGKLLDVTYVWEAPVNSDSQKQIEILNKVIDRGADAILIAANDPIAISDAIRRAKDKNIKIVYVDSPANEEAIITLSTDNYLAGKLAANTMISELERLGIQQGSIGIIGVNTLINTTMLREQGFREAIAANGNYTLLETVYTGGDTTASQTAAEQMIVNNSNLVGILGTNEDTTIGVGNAIKSGNSNVIGIGFDKSNEILRLIREGYLKASLSQNPYTMGYLGMAEAYAALNELDTGPDFIDTGVSILYKR